MANKHENLERYLFMQKLVKAKLYDDLEDVINKMVNELESKSSTNTAKTKVTKKNAK